MPKKRLWLFLLLIAVGVGYLGVQVSSISKENEQEYYELYYAKSPLPKDAQQEKVHVRKDLWINKGGVRHHHAIISPSSEVKIVSFSPNLVAIETFPQLECYLQEELSNTLDGKPQQELRVFEAKSGTYNYQKQVFIAQKVNFSDYHLKGNELPIKDHLPHPFLAGKAASAVMKFKDHAIQAKANHIQATVFDPKKKS